MNSVHIHLLLNHFPTIGFCIGLALFVIALVRRNHDLQQAGMVIFFVTAALTIATYVSGNDAQEAIRESAGFPEAQVKAHESAALIAFVFMQATGFFAWLGLWMARRLSRIANWNLAIVLLLAVRHLRSDGPRSRYGRRNPAHGDSERPGDPTGRGQSDIGEVLGCFCGE